MARIPHPKARLGLACAAFVLAATAALVEPTPHELPLYALGSTLLLYAERAVALLALGNVAMVFCWRMASGDLPMRVGQIEHEPRKVDDELWDAISRLEEHICSVELGLRTAEQSDLREEER